MIGFDSAALLARLRREHEDIKALRQSVAACLEQIETSGETCEAVANAIAAHLGTLTLAGLSEDSRTIWREQVARSLKSDPERPLTERALNALRAWPQARVAVLLDALAALEQALASAQIEAQNAIFHAEISWEYS